MAICGEHENTWRTPEELLLDPLDTTFSPCFASGIKLAPRITHSRFQIIGALAAVLTVLFALTVPPAKAASHSCTTIQGSSWRVTESTGDDLYASFNVGWNTDGTWWAIDGPAADEHRFLKGYWQRVPNQRAYLYKSGSSNLRMVGGLVARSYTRYAGLHISTSRAAELAPRLVVARCYGGPVVGGSTNGWEYKGQIVPTWSIS